MHVDFGNTAGDYAKFRAGFPDSFFDRLAALGLGLAGQSVVDVGSGTGTLARGFAKRGCRVIGIDIAEPMLAQARSLANADGLDAEFRVGRAEDTGLPTGFADLVTAGQCWHWFDRAAAAREAMRLLRPNAALVIAHFDWLPQPGNVVDASLALVEKFNPAWTDARVIGPYPQWEPDVRAAGFERLESFEYEVAQPYTHEGWRGRIRASAGMAGSLSPERVAEFDADHAALLAQRHPSPNLAVPHGVFALVARVADGDVR